MVGYTPNEDKSMGKVWGILKRPGEGVQNLAQAKRSGCLSDDDLDTAFEKGVLKEHELEAVRALLASDA